VSNIKDSQIKDLKIGNITYECQYGYNIKAKVTSEPEQVCGVDEKPAWKWKAVNTQNGEEIEYMLTEGLSHYGPRLYWMPQYAKFDKEKGFVYELYGGGSE